MQLNGPGNPTRPIYASFLLRFKPGVHGTLRISRCAASGSIGRLGDQFGGAKLVWQSASQWRPPVVAW